MAFMNGFCLYLSLFLFSLSHGLCQVDVCSDLHVLESLGDHGDRLYTLEQVMKNLTQEIWNLKSDVHHLRSENDNLKKAMTNVTKQCEARCGTTSNVSTQGPSVYTTSAGNQSTSQSPLITSPGRTDVTTINTWTPANMATILPSVTSPDPANVTMMNTFPSANITMVLPQITTHGPANNTQTNTLSANMTIVLPSHGPSHVTVTNTLSTANITTLPTTSTFAPTPMKSSTPNSPTTTFATITAEPVFDDCEHALGQEGLSISARAVNIKLGPEDRVVKAVCKQENGAVWMVIQRRSDGLVNFDQTWSKYKQGFGNVDPNGEFWLGNENIYQATSSADHILRIDMYDWGGNSGYAEYEHFRVGDETNKYILFVGSYSGTAGDSFHYPLSYTLQHHQMPFSTRDHDNDNSFMNCARELRGGWWFNGCYSSNLNGVYMDHPYGQRMQGESYGNPTMEGTGIEWYPYKHRQYSMKTVEMKITNIRHVSMMG